MRGWSVQDDSRTMSLNRASRREAERLDRARRRERRKRKMPLFETKRIDLGDGEWAQIKELSVGQLREADQKGTEAAVALMKMVPEKIVESQLAEQRERAMERIVRYEGYDPETLIRYGLTDWSFQEPCDEEHKAHLSAKKGEIIARAIFELSVILSGEVPRSSPSYAEVESQGDFPALTTSTPPEEPSV